MTNKQRKSQKGFTLVELAIVLVIIGLIVGGVLVGQDLIRQAELRATVRQLQEFQVGVNTFIGKYNAIPGDVNGDPLSLTGGCDGGNGDGDGDGLIEDREPATADARDTHNGEVTCFWANLTTDGRELVKGSFDARSDSPAVGVNDVVGQNLPKMKFTGNGVGVYTDGTDNYFVLGVVGAKSDDAYATVNVLQTLDARDIDDKIDDGIANTGDVVARDAADDDPHTVASNASTPDEDDCYDLDDGSYYLGTQKINCNLSFKMETF